MAKCVFSGIEVQIASIPNMDAYEVKSEHWRYWITGFTSSSLSASSNSLPQKQKFLCLQEAIKLNRNGLIPLWSVDSKTESGQDKYPKVVLRTVSDFSKGTIVHKDKDSGILNLLADKVSENSINPFEDAALTVSDRYFLGIFDPSEYVDRINYLKGAGVIKFSAVIRNDSTPADESDLLADSKTNQMLDGFKLALTNSGWEVVHAQNVPTRSKKAFIAMAFTDGDGKELDNQLKDALIKTVDSCGYEALVVSDVQHNDGIMDKIVSLISDSRFVIAELTHQKSGVYYEAGFAKGKNLPVIHIVQKSDLEKCHFDVKHLNLIVWSSLDELIDKLAFRIKATIAN